MPAQGKSWCRDWGQATNRAIASLSASKRQVNADYNARIRLVRDAQRDPSNCAPHIEQLIRAPLAGLK